MAEKPNIDVSPVELTIISDILERHVPEHEVWAFGSRATWRSKAHSDLDLAIIGDAPLPLAVSAALADDFEESNLPFKVDVVDWATTSEAFRAIIERDKVVAKEKSSSSLGLGWKKLTIDDLCKAGLVHVQTGPFGSQLHAADYVEQGVPVVPTEAIGRRHLKVEGLPQVSKETASRLSRHRLREGDILFARRGAQATGLSAVVGPELTGGLCGTGAILLRTEPGNQVIDPAFLSFLLSADASVEWFKAHAVGAVMPNINDGIIRRFQMALPPFLQQKAIAELLGALDDKIDLNHRMNETLEAMARAVFKSWFIDLDDEAQVFSAPPIARSTARLSDVVDLLGGGTPTTSRDEYWGGDIPWFSVVDAPNVSDVFVLATEKTITQPGLENSSTRLLPQFSTIVTARGTVGKVALTARPMAMNQSCYGVRGKGGRAAFFTYFLVRSCIQGLQARTHGSVFDTITRATFDAIEINDPGAAVTQAFDSAVEPFLLKIKANLEQSHTLAALRDLLLPRLLSGELRIPDAEKAVEAVA